jgi:DNA polymerase-4
VRRTGDGPVASQAELERFTYALLEPIFPVRLGVRLLGVTLSSIDRDEPEQERQLTLAL